MGKVPDLPVISKQLPDLSLIQNLSHPFLVILGQIIMGMCLSHLINNLKYEDNNSFTLISIDFMAMKLFHFMQLAAISAFKDETR